MNLGGDQDSSKAFYDLPLVYTPLTRLTNFVGTRQHGPCAPYELDYARCAEHIGERRAQKECRNYYEDLRECVWRLKTNDRYLAMMKERHKQGRETLPPPEKDSVKTPIATS